ncbi:transposase [Parasedimentitalea psychrophila]|uniref:Transposase n=1 Tax=Parasedimentitalea psychrophila TaxID=2997337 RepID=A0A9Y2P038_9RHOB|nr:transposase [Parasedimentitalea psychrophila]WIY24211.1 transposase [Parasedimentitalea psychrophila]
MGQQRRKYTDDYKAAAAERLYEPGATQGSVSSELGITGTQLKTWRLEIEVFYNRQRRHSGIQYKTPLQAFEDTTMKMAA